MWIRIVTSAALLVITSGSLADPIAETVLQPTFTTAAGAPQEAAAKPVRWEGSFSLALGLFHSTINSSNFSLVSEVHRFAPLERMSFDAGYVLAKQSSVTSAEQFFANGDYDHIIGKRAFYYVDGKLKKDRIQRLDLRYLLGAGLGYLVVDQPETHFSVKAGIAYLNEKFIGAKSQSNVTGEFGYAFDHLITKGLSFKHDFYFYPHLSDFGNNYWVTTAGLSQVLAGSWTLDVKYFQDYNSKVPPGATRSSNSLLIGVGKKF